MSGSKYDKPLTITVTADDWRRAREEERFQERLADKIDYGNHYDPKLREQRADYSCICVLAQAIMREIPFVKDATEGGANVQPSDCKLRFRNGTDRYYHLDANGAEIIDKFDSKVHRAKENRKVRAPMPRRLVNGVQVTLTPV